MMIRSLTPEIVTDKLSESRDFYTQFLGYKPIFENDRYVQLRSTGDSPVDVVLSCQTTKPSRQYSSRSFVAA